MQNKDLREIVLEGSLTETVFDIQNFLRNLSARVPGWPFFKLSDRAQLMKGGQILLDPGLRERWCSSCGVSSVFQRVENISLHQKHKPDVLPSKPGAGTFPFWIYKQEMPRAARRWGGFLMAA